MFEEQRCLVSDDTSPIDWKNAEWLRKFLTDNGRILPRRLTGNSL